MDSKDYHKVCEAVDDIVPSLSKDVVHNDEDIVLEETNGTVEDNEVGGINETKMEIDTIETADEIKTESNVVQQQFVGPLVDNNCDIVEKEHIVEENETKNTLRKSSFGTINSVTSSELTTAQDNTPTSSSDAEAGSVSPDQTKIKRSISKDQINGDNGISMEKFGNSSDEDSSKRQKLNEGVSNKSKSDDKSVENPHQSSSKENGNHCNEGGTEDVEMKQEEDTTSTGTENSELAVEDNYDSIGDTEDTEDTEDTKNTGDSEDTKDTKDTDDSRYPREYRIPSEEESDEEVSSCLNKKKPKPNWFVVPELLRREIGNNPLFRRKYYGSLRVVEHFELMEKLEEHNGCVNALNFNQKGSLLASGSDDLAVVIWDWAIGKKRHVFDSGHKSNLFQTKWLPFDVEYLMATCARDGEVRLLDVRRGISRKIAMHHGQIHRLAVHADIPHVIISAGEDAEVLSIDIREEKPTKLVVVEDNSSKVRLYSVHSNPRNSNEFCVAGQSHLVKVYDRRNVSTPLYNLCPEHLAGKNDEHITCAVYNYNGTEILASYKDEDIYLFNTTLPSCGNYAHRYQGHRNNATVKGVNFFGPKSEYVISGSDCGNIFIWDKNTEAIVNWLYGDESGVVNCLEPHPCIPILATSGLDSDVKIWIPSCEKPPSMEGLKSCVKFNAKHRAFDNLHFTNAFTSRMFLILVRGNRAAQRNARRGSHDHNSDDDDDDDFDDDDDNDNDNDDYSFFLGS